MKLKLVFPVLLMSLSSAVFVTPVTADNSYNRNVVVVPLSIPLYLPLTDSSQGAWSVPGSNGLSQLTIRPTTTISSVKTIRVQSYLNSNGTCVTTFGPPYDITNPSETVTLLGGRSYVTTDASNYDLKLASTGLTFSPKYGNVYQLLDNSSNVIATSPCITGSSSSSSCNSETECGWNSVRTWEPSPLPSY